MEKRQAVQTRHQIITGFQHGQGHADIAPLIRNQQGVRPQGQRKPQQCQQPHGHTRERTQALDSELRAAERSVAEKYGNVSYVDFTELFCNATTCPSIIGNTLVYRDGSHITTEMSRVLSGAFIAAAEGYLRSAETTGPIPARQDILTMFRAPRPAPLKPAPPGPAAG